MFTESIQPSDAIDEYLRARKSELAEATIQNQHYRLKQFRLWAEEQGIDDMRDLSGRELEQFRLARERDGLVPLTVRNHMISLRTFLEFCTTQGYVENELPDLVRTPDVAKADESRDVHIDAETAEEIIDAFQKYHYASLRHIIFHLLIRTGLRTGSLRALDVGDVHLGKDPWLEIRHRPETGTPLKRGENGGERHVSLIDDELVEALGAYLERKRHNVTDDYGREPLIASQYGRLAKSSIQSHVYRATQPCERGNCPHGEDPDSCDYRAANTASQCPSSVSPHALRRSAISVLLDTDVSKDVVSGRANVSRKRLEQHYDARDEESKRKKRRRQMEDW
jgi:integrase